MNSLPTEKKSRSFLRARIKSAAQRPFNRESELPKLLGLWPSELRDFSLAGTARIVALLRKAIRSERQRGRGGHWTYDLSRHLGLAEALKAERVRLRELEKAESVDELAGPKAFAIKSRKRLRLVSASAVSDRRNSAGVLLGTPDRVEFVSDADR